MKKFLVAAVALSMIVSSACFAAEVTVGGDIEIIYSYITVDDGDTKDTSAKFNTTDADVNVKAVIDENTSAFIKLDVDDIEGGAVSETALLEEIFLTFKNINGLPLAAKVGKQEVPFGLDYDLGISDPYTHGSSGDSYLNSVHDLYGSDSADKVDHFGEVDNKFGITLSSSPIDDKHEIEFCVFQNARGVDSTEEDAQPEDNGFQSYAVRVTSSRLENLKAEVSYISMHQEGANSASRVDNTRAVSVGAVFNMKPVKVFGEAIIGRDLKYMTDVDQNIYQIGVAVDPIEKLTLVLQWNAIEFKDNNTHDNPTLYKAAFAPKYKLDNGVELALEYVREELHMDKDPQDDISADVVSARVKYSF